MNHAARQPIPVVAAGVIQPPVRTAQNVLAERRATVDELRSEKDATARAMLQFSIDQLDHELHTMHGGTDAISDAFAATHAKVANDAAFEQSNRTIEQLVAERDARDAKRVDGFDKDWSPAQHCARAA